MRFVVASMSWCCGPKAAAAAALPSDDEVANDSPSKPEFALNDPSKPESSNDKFIPIFKGNMDFPRRPCPSPSYSPSDDTPFDFITPLDEEGTPADESAKTAEEGAHKAAIPADLEKLENLMEGFPDIFRHTRGYDANGNIKRERLPWPENSVPTLDAFFALANKLNVSVLGNPFQLTVGFTKSQEWMSQAPVMFGGFDKVLG